jgi:hypothetical protein
MNCFQLIKTVLDEAYDAISGTTVEKDAAIEEAFENLSKDYQNLLNKGCLDYSDPCRRFAYIYKYTTSHANLVYSKIDGHKVLKELFDRVKLTISCIGGGPGSDFLGIMKYCLRSEKSVELKCQILDRDPAWSESWSDVDDKVESTFRISTSHQPLDVADPVIWNKFSKHFSADLFTLIYFMSEVYAVRDRANDYFAALMANMKPGALLLYVDNNDSRFTNWFDGLASNAGLEVVHSESGWEGMPYEEQKTHLQPYYNKFTPDPKLKANIACRIVRKPAS